MKKSTISLPCVRRVCRDAARQYLFVISIIVSLLFTSCGVLLDDAKFRGLWHLTDVKFYQYNEDFNSYLAIEGIGPNTKNKTNGDTSPDTNAPLMSNFFGVTMTNITMTINTNKTWTLIFSIAILVWLISFLIFLPLHRYSLRKVVDAKKQLTDSVDEIIYLLSKSQYSLSEKETLQYDPCFALMKTMF